MFSSGSLRYLSEIQMVKLMNLDKELETKRFRELLTAYRNWHFTLGAKEDIPTSNESTEVMVTRGARRRNSLIQTKLN
jgi:hypothetical protein